MQQLEEKLKDLDKMTQLEIHECQKVFVIKCVEKEEILWETGRKTRKRGKTTQKWHQIMTKLNAAFPKNRLNGNNFLRNCKL